MHLQKCLTFGVHINQELEFYLLKLFMWLQDMNWPGADLIFQRLQKMPLDLLRLPYEISYKLAHRMNDMVWLSVLEDFGEIFVDIK